MKLSSKYAKVYFNLIERARDRILAVQTEKHHIIPRSLGGTDAKSNLVRLTLREHFLAHCLLVKMADIEERRKMLFALGCMSRGRTLTSRQFEIAKCAKHQAQLGKKASEGTRAKMSESQKGKVLSESAKQSLSVAKIGKSLSSNHRAAISAGQLGKKRGPCSEARRQAISLGNTGVSHGSMSDDHKQKISCGNSGKVRTPEMRERYKQAWIVRRAVKESQCA